MTEIKIPKDVYEVINNPNVGFDLMYEKERSLGNSKKESFQNTMDRINEHFPDYSPYSCLKSYLVVKRREFNVNIPKDVYDAINDIGNGFDRLFYGMLPNYDTQEEAFNAAIGKIKKHFPNFKRYSHYESYRISRNARNKKMLLKNKRPKQ